MQEKIPETIIDVRERDEFQAEHIDGSINIPLSVFSAKAPKEIESLNVRNLVLMCQAGKRAELALGEINKMNLNISSQVFLGGLNEWKNQGRPVQVLKSRHFPIMRQVQLIAGSIVLSSAILSYTLNTGFILIAAFVGTGLILAGATGFCGMALLLAKMPWNRS